MKLSTAVLAKWQSYFKLRDDGTTVELAAARAGLSPSSAYRYERGEESAQGMRAALALERGDLPVAAVNELAPAVEPSEASGTEYLEPIRTTPEGERALKDFAYFRFRYFGRKSMPWQVRAAEQVALMLSTRDREYVVMNEPPGCLSGDTIVTVNRKGNARRERIADLYRKGLTEGMRISQARDGSSRLGEVEEIVSSGRKLTFWVVTLEGKKIRATKEHRFLRPDGSYTELGDLKVYDKIMVRGERGKKEKQPRNRYASTYTKYHPYQRKGKGGFRVPTHRLVAEASLNGIRYENYLIILREVPEVSARLRFLRPDEVVHHINHDHTDNSPGNLAVTTVTDHHKHHAEPKSVLYPIVEDQIVLITEFGYEETYDISMMEEPNFIADEFVVHNSGKSTLLSHDVLCWMIARDRTIRIQIGSRTERQARMYVGRIKRSLERPSPMLAVQEDKERGLAFDAEATLESDYGVFRPGGREDLWRAEGLVVRQPSGVALDDKEPTVSAWGMDSGFLGGRFDLVVWDDLVDRKNTATVEARDKLAEWYFTEAETRLEPGGLFLLQGQRIAADDLYRTALDQVRFDGSTKYSHIVYPAHDESKCNNVHGKRARPWPEGCLLDPYRLPWHQLETIRHNNPRIFSVMYQQTDGMGIGGLVEQAWLEGGVDSDGYEAVGCYDLKRIIKQPPVGHEAMFSFITVDPSPTEYWGVLRWLYDPVTQVRHLMDIRRLKMRPDDWLWFDMNTAEYTGELIKMVADSDLEGNRVSHVIVEINAAQRWLLSQPHVQTWQSQERIHFIQHTTTRNKLDPEYGVETIAPFFREGRVRIPWGNTASRIEFRPLIDELLRYPEGQTTDLVMSTWFSVLAVDHHYQGDRRRAWSKTTVPWFRGVRRGIA